MSSKDERRHLIRLNVKPAAKQVLSWWREETGITEVVAASKILEWFGAQPEEVQRAILGLYGDRGPDVARLFLEELAAQQKKGGAGRTRPGKEAREKRSARPRC
jgi:hypothetical protein